MSDRTATNLTSIPIFGSRKNCGSLELWKRSAASDQLGLDIYTPKTMGFTYERFPFSLTFLLFAMFFALVSSVVMPSLNLSADISQDFNNWLEWPQFYHENGWDQDDFNCHVLGTNSILLPSEPAVATLVNDSCADLGGLCSGKNFSCGGMSTHLAVTNGYYGAWLKPSMGQQGIVHGFQIYRYTIPRGFGFYFRTIEPNTVFLSVFDDLGDYFFEAIEVAEPLSDDYHEYGLLWTQDPGSPRCVHFFIDAVEVASYCDTIDRPLLDSLDTPRAEIHSYALNTDIRWWMGDWTEPGTVSFLRCNRFRIVVNATWHPDQDRPTGGGGDSGNTDGDGQNWLEENLGIVIGSGVAVVIVAVVVLILIVAISIFCLIRCKGKRRGKKNETGVRELRDQDFRKSLAVLSNDTAVIEWEQLQFTRLIGRGGSGTKVFHCLWNTLKFEDVGHSVPVAVKVFKLENLNSDSEETRLEDNPAFIEFKRELELMCTLGHPSILRLFGYSINDPKVGIVMMFCGNGDWKSFLKKKKREEAQYPLLRRLQQLRDVASGMAYMHSIEVIHRDLKTNNVLIDEAEDPHIMDFGLSRRVESLSVSKTKGIGTSFHMAPEIVLGQEYTNSVDVFSFGMMAYQVLTDIFNLFDQDEYVEYKIANQPDFRPDLSEIDDSTLTSLLDSCWQADPSKRPSFLSICRSLDGIMAVVADGEGIVIYLRREGDSDADAEDVNLTGKTMKGLQDLVRSVFGLEGSKMELVHAIKGGNEQILQSDADVEKLEEEELVIVRD